MARTEDDSTLELMTQHLLSVSSVFLIQQHELQEVRDRLQKELTRVTRIQEELIAAAQQHQAAQKAAAQHAKGSAQRARFFRVRRYQLQYRELSRAELGAEMLLQREQAAAALARVSLDASGGAGGG